MAFITTGASVFDNARITSVLKALKLVKEKYIPKSQIVDDLPLELRKFYGRSFFIYQKPKPKERYWIGVDTSEGVKQDYSTCIVMNKEGQEVAMFKNNEIKPYMFADFVNELGRYYNKAHLVVEKASGGHSVIEKLKYTHKYVNMAKYKTYDEFNIVKYKTGFDTNQKTKSIAINDFRELFEKGQVQLNSEELLEEMKVYEMNDSGSMGAMSGYHDDLVMATALCIQGIKTNIQYKW